MYVGQLNSKDDICEQFQIDTDILKNCVVLFAAYEYENYEGSAEVIFAEGGKIYMVHGAHCSCYGLEGQWEPVEMSADGLKRILNEGSGLLHDNRNKIPDIEELEKSGFFELDPEQAAIYIALRY